MALIERIRIAGAGGTVPVEIYPCKFKDMVVWQRKIHKPFIAPQGGIGADWDWPAYFLGCTLTERALLRQALAFQIRIAGPTGEAVPVAQAIFSMPYPFPGNSRERCVFIWFIAATPEPALKSFGVPHTFAMMAPLLDTAIQLSIAHGMNGRIGLHAAFGASESESAKLSSKYLKHGLKVRPKQAGYFRWPVRREDGRLFYFDAAAASVYAAKQDDLR